MVISDTELDWEVDVFMKAMMVILHSTDCRPDRYIGVDAKGAGGTKRARSRRYR